MAKNPAYKKGEKLDLDEQFSMDINDMLQDTLKHLEVDKKKCIKCGAESPAVKLCATTGSSNIVPYGTENSWIECYDTVDCRKRRSSMKDSKHDEAKPEYKKPWESSQNKFDTGFNGTTYVQKCRHAATKAFEIGDLSFYGGSESKVEYEKFDASTWLVVSLLGKKPYAKEILWSKLPWLSKLAKFVDTPFEPQVVIDWPDMGVPALHSGFWMNLVANAATSGYKHILFYCWGGHGRTGTALASVLIECADLDPFAAVTLVRKDYCKEAVESESQVKYLKALYKVVLKGE